MSEKYGGIIFVSVMLVAIASAILVVVVEENKTRVAAVKKCEDAGWTWLSNEAKCIMVKEVK